MKITIYTTPTCVYCRPVKEFITRKGHKYTEIDVTKDPEAKQNLYELTGRLLFPTVVVLKDDIPHLIVGMNLQKLGGLID